MMTKRSGNMIQVVFGISITILILFLLSVPIAYAFVYSLWGTIILKAIRFFLVVAISFMIRKKKQGFFFDNKPQQKKYMWIIFSCICASICLHYCHVIPWLYGTISTSIGIYKTIPLLTILWEQMFNGELYWNILLSLAIVFFHYKQLNKVSSLSAES